MKLLKMGILAAVGLFQIPAYAARPNIVGGLPGYGCMVLNLTEQQSLSPSTHVPVRALPSASAPVAGYAPGIVIVREPAVVRNGFIEALFPTGKTVWIEAGMLKPYHSIGDPTAKCRAVQLSNGGASFDLYH